jgi:conjugative relaxase-like TrwC/TraI family protein
VTTLKGAAAGVYYTQELGQYYLDAGEPPGQWFGAQAHDLGLDGESDPSHFLSLTAGRLPISERVMGRLYGKESARGYDVTFNAPKSVSLLWAFGDDTIRSDVLAAHDTAVRAVLGWLEERAHTRVTRDKQTFVVDTQGLMVGLFEQHTSRTGDPHLHTHAVVIAKVRDGAGNWMALDARMLLKDQRTLSALYHAGLRSELTRRLGVQWHAPDNGIAELAGIGEDVLARFSTRTDQFETRLQDKLDRFRADLGREPSTVERWRLEREAVRDSRPRKDTTVTGTVLSARWRDNLATLGLDADALTAAVIGRHVDPERITQLGAAEIAAAARAELIGSASTWRLNDLVREIARRIPTDTTADAELLFDWITGTAELVSRADIELAPAVQPGTPLRGDGRPVTESDLEQRFTTDEILAQEELITAWALDRQDTRGLPAPVARGKLDRAQQAAAQAVAGSAPLVVIVGPAGAGKTACLRAAVDHLNQHQRPVFGLAPSATAARVLSDQTAMLCDTVDKLLYEHRDQQPRPPYALPAGTTVLVDEAGMLSTPKFADLVQVADQQQWRVVLIGDPRQLSPVGRGGMFNHLVDSCDVIELDRVHRFHEPWERDASLGLRRGDTRALDQYETHGRLHEGTAIDITRAAVREWRTHRDNGDDVVMLAITNDTVAKLNLYAQQHRVFQGEINRDHGVRGRDCFVHVGDDIVTRANNRNLRTDRGEMVRNHARWTVTAITPDGNIEAAGTDGNIVLPADYVSTWVELGYAQTVHGAQGRTVDHGLLVIDSNIDGRGLYVGMTRGAHSNHAYITIDGNRTARDLLRAAVHGDWADTPAIDIRTHLRRREALRAGIGQPVAPNVTARTAADRLRDLGRNPELPDHGHGLGF